MEKIIEQLQVLAGLVKQLITENRRLAFKVGAKQAKIDALMLEYCPEEITPDQRAEWARHQRPARLN